MERNANAKAQAEPKVTVPPDANAEQADAPKTDESRRSKNARLGKQVHEASSGIQVFGDSVAIAPAFANPRACKYFNVGALLFTGFLIQGFGTAYSWILAYGLFDLFGCHNLTLNRR